MEAKFTASCEDWISRAEKVILRFWEPKHAYFYRDSAELRKSTASYYPTATFACVAALERRELLLGRTNKNARYDYIHFLKKLRRSSIAQVIAGSSVNPDGEAWNVYTAVVSVRALTFVRLNLERRITDLEIDLNLAMKLLFWVDDAIEEQLALISAHLAAQNGAALPRGRIHPFLTFLAVETISFPAALGIGKDVSTPVKARLSERAESDCRELIANHTLRAASPADLVALLYSASLLYTFDSIRYRGIASHSLALICKAQAQTGGWPLGRSLIYAPSGNGVQISSFDIGARIAQLGAKLIGHAPSDEPAQLDATVVDSALEGLFALVTASLVSTREAKPVEGWCNDHAYAHPVVEAWTSAIVLTFLLRLREYGRLRIRQRVSGSYDAAWPSSMQGWRKWEKVQEPDPERPILKFIHERFIERRDPWTRRSGNPAGVSMILFGPPGTSKTTIVKAMARELNWPLITITPGVFLARGTDAIDAQASSVFADFQQLDDVVLLFDECDELFRKRPEAMGDAQELSLAALITGAMLPRLQDLHDRGRVIFVIATNRLDAIDPAVKRPGRTDYVIPVGPPELSARVELLKSTAPALRRNVEAIASVMERFTLSEIITVAKALNNFVAEHPRVGVGRLIEEVDRIMPDAQLTIEKPTWERFVTLRKTYPVPVE
jgi:hypothetical protein